MKIRVNRAPVGYGGMQDTRASSRGVLYPARLPTFCREAATGEHAAFVRWFWMSEWAIAPGQSSRQHVVGFPASNLVVVDGSMIVTGPTTRASYRDLTGEGWAVGALLRPAAIPDLVGDVQMLRDKEKPLDHPELFAAVAAAMNIDAPPARRYGAAASVLGAWLSERLGAPTAEGLLANRLVDTVESDKTFRTVSDLADYLQVSTRTLQRLAARYIGLSPWALIRRHRLHEAIERLRIDPEANLTAIAHDLGYADHAHLAADFRDVLGVTPSAYRAEHVHTLPNEHLEND